jgi:hypothetical protein
MEHEWEALCTYIQMLNTRLPDLQKIRFASKAALSERLMGVEEDDLGAALVDLGTGEGVPGGGLCTYVERHWGRIGG